jgi:hypothetical protein
MRFLLIGQPPPTPAIAEALTRHGHEAVTPESVGLTNDSPKEQIIKDADKAQLDILTGDPDLVEAPYQHEIWFKRTIVFLQLEGGDVEQDDAVDRLFERYKRLNPRRVYTVTGTRVKIRQLPGPP